MHCPSAGINALEGLQSVGFAAKKVKKGLLSEEKSCKTNPLADFAIQMVIALCKQGGGCTAALHGCVMQDKMMSY